MLAVVLKSKTDFLEAYVIKNALLFYTNNLKIDMLKTICTALKHELVSSKPVKI